MKHMMEFTAEMIAGFLGGDIVGNKDAKVHTVSSIEEGRAGSLAYRARRSCWSTVRSSLRSRWPRRSSRWTTRAPAS